MAGIERGYRLGAGQHAVAGKDVDERLAVQRSRVKVEQRSDLGVGVQQTRIRQRFRRHARAVGVAKPSKANVERQLIEGNGTGRVMVVRDATCTPRSSCGSVGSDTAREEEEWGNCSEI